MDLCAHSVSVCVGGPARCACQRCLVPCTWRGNQNGYRCSSSALPISGWRFCGGLSDRYCSCGVLLSVSVFQVLRLFSPGRCSVFLKDWILCPSWRLCTAGFTAPALPGYLHLHCVLESAPALPAYLHLHCVLELSNKDCLFSLAIGSRASVSWHLLCMIRPCRKRQNTIMWILYCS